MIAQEIIAELRTRGLDVSPEIFDYLAEHIYDAELFGGHRISDASDAVGLMRELASAARFAALPVATMRRRLIESTCPRCGHIHQGEAECGEEMGGGRLCRCELPVRA